MQTIPHVRTDSMGIPREQKVHVNRLRLISRAGPPQRCSDTTPGGLHQGREQTWIPWINSGKVEAWKTSVSLRENRKTLPLFCFFCHLLSIRDWTLCTSSRATFKICWTSWRSAISADEEKIIVTYRNLNWFVPIKHGVQVSRHHYNKYNNVQRVHTATGWRYTAKWDNTIDQIIVTSS